MKIIIPVAGMGIRLRPHTHTVPKVLMQVAGKPILGHILEKLEKIKFSEIILIVGYMKDKIKEYVNQNFNFNVSYIEQKERLGLGNAVWLAKRKACHEPVLIIYGDTIFEADIQEAINLYVDGCLGVKSVTDPRRFGIAEIENGFVKKLTEKPTHPTTNLAIVGVNFIRNSSLLFDCLDEIMIHKIKTKGEFQLTDAFQLMIEKGAKFKTFSVKKWLDCGTSETLLATNRELLSSIRYPVSKKKCKGLIIIPPVFIHPLSKIKNSIVGPYVSVAQGTKINNSIISNSIINPGAKIEKLLLNRSIIGANTIVRGNFKKLNVGDSSIVEVS
ncbi:NTP transferase domain-containing protein [candidate division WOR-3 bacterium]|nr:NTP transferase domain-containing protein [candidate division WOR-3 bacterium]